MVCRCDVINLLAFVIAFATSELRVINSFYRLRRSLRDTYCLDIVFSSKFLPRLVQRAGTNSSLHLLHLVACLARPFEEETFREKLRTCYVIFRSCNFVFPISSAGIHSTEWTEHCSVSTNKFEYCYQLFQSFRDENFRLICSDEQNDLQSINGKYFRKRVDNTVAERKISSTCRSFQSEKACQSFLER